MIRMLKRHHELRVPADETMQDFMTGIFRRISPIPQGVVTIPRIDEHTVRTGKTMRIPAIRSRPERIHNGKRTAFIG